MRTREVASCMEGGGGQRMETGISTISWSLSWGSNSQVLPKSSSCPCSICDVRTWVSTSAFPTAGLLCICGHLIFAGWDIGKHRGRSTESVSCNTWGAPGPRLGMARPLYHHFAQVSTRGFSQKSRALTLRLIRP